MILTAALHADESRSVPEPKPLIEPATRPIEPSTTKQKPPGIDWGGVLKGSAGFLAVEHSFRILTEAGTRQGMNQIPRGYLNAVGNLHGWADGDEFYVNYVGHSMQGAVAAYIWAQNDRQYKNVEFGLNSRYWKGRLRATAFSWVYSTQFEIGPISEASIGQVQAHHPQQGLVDHVATPVAGLAWMLAEDALDKYVIKKLEGRISNRYARLLLRGGLNPSRSFANAVGGRVPWHREDRRGVFSETEQGFLRRRGPTENSKPEPPDGVAPFELTVNTTFRTSTHGTCLGGGASSAFRLGAQWQLVGDVNGCSLPGLGPNTSGDSLSFLAGPRWAPAASGRWSPYVQVLAGGQKLSIEEIFPRRKQALELIAQLKNLPPPEHSDYSRQEDTTGFSLAAGAGLDVKLHAALALRVVSVDYTRTWASEVSGNRYRSDLRFTSGLVLRLGTW